MYLFFSYCHLIQKPCFFKNAKNIEMEKYDAIFLSFGKFCIYLDNEIAATIWAALLSTLIDLIHHKEPNIWAANIILVNWLNRVKI